MSTDTIELSTDAAKGIIPCLEGQLEALRNQAENLEREIADKAKVLAEIKARLSGKESQTGAEGKRLRKGEAERIIAQLLQAQPPGSGLTIQEVVEQSGVPYSSTFRILNQNKKGLFDNPEGLWVYHKK